MKVKNNLKKRIMSFVLALCMVAAIAPVLPAAEAATDWGDGSGKYHIYDFRKGNNWSNGTQSPLLSEITYDHTDSDAESTSELNPDIYSDPWVAANIVTSGSGATYYYAETQMNMGIFVDSPADALPVFKIKVEEAGTYVPRVILASTWRIDSTNFYGGAIKAKIGKFSDTNAEFGKYSVSSILSENTITVNATAIEGPIRIELPAVYLEKGEYALQITGPWRKSYEQYYQNNGDLSGVTTNTSGRFYLRSLELLTSNEYVEKRATTTEVEELTYDFTVMNGVADTQAKVNAITYDDTVEAGSEPWTVYGYLPDAHTNSTTLWNVQKDGFLYGQNLLPAAKRGEALNLLGSGKHIGGAIMLHVPASGDYVVKFNGGNGHNQPITYYLMKLNADRSVDTCNTYRNTDEGKKLQISTSGVNDYYFNNGEAISLEAGEYILGVNCIAYYDTLFNSLTLTPEKEPEPPAEPRSLVYDFAKAYGSTDVSTITYDNTTAGGASEMNSNVISDPWAASFVFPGNDANWSPHATGCSINMGIDIYRTADGGYNTFKFKVPAGHGGNYIPAITLNGVWNEGYGAGGKVDIVVGELDANGKIASEICSVTQVNAISLHGPFKVFLVDPNGNPIAFEAGKEYGLQIKHHGANNAVYDATFSGIGPKVYVRKFELLLEGDYQKKLDIDEDAGDAKLVYDFTVLNKVGVNDTQADANAITYESSSAAGSEPWTISGYLQGDPFTATTPLYDDNANAFYHKYDGKGLTLEASKYSAGSIMIHVPKSGRYTVKVAADVGSLDMNYYLMPLKADRSVGKVDSAGVCTTIAEDRALTALVKKSGGLFNLNSASSEAAVELEAGEYVLLMYNTSATDEIDEGTVNSLTLTPEGWKETIPESEIFGDTYAYVKDGTVYFIGGLQTIENYTEVGFEVWVNGIKADDINTNEVYTSFTVNNQTVNAANWNSSFIFITSKSDLNKGDIVTVKPYIANGTAKTYHDDLELELVI